jgi:L-rhamnose mutarotase
MREDWMKRYGTMLRLKPGAEETYRKYHQAVWPEVLRMIADCNIRNYSIYLKDDILFGYFEYHGADFEADMKKMAADPKTQEWWAVMMPLQEPIPTRKEGEWWAEMDEVFHAD